jgi:starch synthase
VSRDRLRVLLVASEVEPFAKTGGLADVTGALPRALADLGHDVRVLLPRYPGVERTAGELRPAVPALAVPISDHRVPGAVLEGRLGGRLPAYFVAHDPYYARPDLYGHPDDCERFTFLCRAALAALPELGWMPHVVHAHDWQAALLPVYLETLYRDAPGYRDVATVFTVHNLAYQGLFPDRHLGLTGLGWDLFTPAGLEFYGQLSLLKGGLVFADQVTTVSPTYAREIQTAEYGEGLDGVLRERSGDLSGILNGLDYEAWNPATDAEVAKRFGPDDPEGKAVCAAALRAEMGLAPPGPGRGGPLVGMVTRLAGQKGVDLAAAAAPALVAAGGQLAVLGVGEAAFEAALAALAAAHPGQVALRPGFDEALARRIYAGVDAFLMPSRYEPCGLAQMIALRYGAIPVVRRTGGLADTVREWDPGTGEGTGFTFEPATAEACQAALHRAAATFADPAAWGRLVRNAFAARFSWEASAESYVTCYRRALKKARRHG